MEDSTFIDAEECEDASDGGVPMFVKHTEDMLDEIDRMVCAPVILTLSLSKWVWTYIIGRAASLDKLH